MKELILIDASMAASWVIPDEYNPISKALLDSLMAREYRPVGIALFWYEFRNILVSNTRRRKIDKNDLMIFLQDIRHIGIETKAMEDDALILQLAFEHHLSAYDAAYLALAVQEKATLATNDKKLARAVLAEKLELRTALDDGALKA